MSHVGMNMPKRSVHIRNENVEIWESLDSPSESVNNMLTDIRNSRPTGDKERKIVRLREKLTQARVGIENYNQRIIEIENECEIIERDLQNALDASNYKINQNDFINVIFSEAERACYLRRELGSIRTNTHWRFHSVTDGKIFVTNLNTKRRPGFKKGVIAGAIEKLIFGQGKVKIGELVSVKWQEDCLIALHPNLRVEGDWITYDLDFQPYEEIDYCMRCGESDFKTIYGLQHDPDYDPDEIGHYCQQCGHRTNLDLDFPDRNEYYESKIDDMIENRIDAYREENRGI